MKQTLISKGLGNAATTAVRLLFAAVAAFPIVFMMVSSLKPDQQIFGDMSSVAAFLPVGSISLDNYAAVFDRVLVHPAARKGGPAPMVPGIGRIDLERVDVRWRA